MSVVWDTAGVSSVEVNISSEESMMTTVDGFSVYSFLDVEVTGVDVSFVVMALSLSVKIVVVGVTVMVDCVASEVKSPELSSVVKILNFVLGLSVLGVAGLDSIVIAIVSLESLVEPVATDPLVTISAVESPDASVEDKTVSDESMMETVDASSACSVSIDNCVTVDISLCVAVL